MSVPTPGSEAPDAGPGGTPSAAAEVVPPGSGPQADEPENGSATRSSAPGEIVRRRRSRRRRHRRYSAAAAWLAMVATLGAGAGISLVYLWHHQNSNASRQERNLQSGYVSDLASLEREYQRMYGRPLDDRVSEQRFQRAGELVRSRSYAEAANLLETTARKVAVPAVFNDLGVLYAELDDRPRAIVAFREALVRDDRYPAVLANLERLRGFANDVKAPVTHEVEPNNNRLTANQIVVGTAVEGEITAGKGDVDFFQFTFPPAPRDVVAVELINHDFRFSPRVDIYNGETRSLDWGRKTAEAGKSLTVYGSVQPNSTVYVEVQGFGQTSGRYTLTIKPMKAYDEYEPNDDIFRAHRIEPNQPVKANIMDLEDTDFYFFVAPRTGTVEVDILNESVTLIPAVQLHGPDMRSIGFGPELRHPGDSLHTTMEVEKNLTYYVQVWPQASTSGAYTLTVH